MDPTQDAQAELTRRHKAAATTVLGLIVATILLSIVAYLGKPYFAEIESRPIDWAFLILVLMLGLGAVAWRRTKFNPTRLQDIFGVAGVSGLIRTLEKTTLQIAFLAAGIAVIGFVATLTTGQVLHLPRNRGRSACAGLLLPDQVVVDPRRRTLRNVGRTTSHSRASHLARPRDVNIC